MKLSDQLKLLLELEDRVSALERMLFKSDKASLLSESQDVEIVKTAESTDKKTKKPKEKKLNLSPDVLRKMSKTELAQVAVSLGKKEATRALQREDLIDLIQTKESTCSDPLEDTRNTIYHFITKVQPSLKQILRCSRDCVGACPTAQVVDCWSSNRSKIEELS